MKKLLKIHWLLILIVILAFVLRTYQLTSVPQSLYWEEAALGYDAYSILKTGKDFHGNPFPIVAFTSFGDYKPPLYFYATVPFVKIFGLNEIAVRLPSVLSGVGTVLVLYGIGKMLYGKKMGLFAALLFAIQPWSMNISRVGFETNLATFLVAFGVLLLLYASQKKIYLVPAAIILVLSMYTYHSARIVAPLLAAFVFFAYCLKHDAKKNIRWIAASIAVASILIFPILSNLRNPEVKKRATETAIFSDIAPIEESNALKAQDENFLIAKILHHRYVLFGEMILENYTRNFSLDFLFISGDENIRHQTQEFGVLYHWEIITVAAGIYIVMKKRKVEYWIPIVWILLSGVPVALTTVVPHTLRFEIASPAFALLSAIGFTTIIGGLKTLFGKRKEMHKAVLVVITLMFLFDIAAYLHFYFSHYAEISARDFQYGYKQLISDLESMKKPNQKIVVTRDQGRPSIYYMFYAKLDPAWVQSQEKIVQKDQGELLELGQYTFTDTIPSDKGILIASSPQKVRKGANVLATISLPNGEKIWEIWEN